MFWAGRVAALAFIARTQTASKPSGRRGELLIASFSSLQKPNQGGGIAGRFAPGGIAGRFASGGIAGGPVVPGAAFTSQFREIAET
jgi:hypothetical protein